MSKAFETDLRDYLESKRKKTAQDRRLLRIMDRPKTNLRRKQIMGDVERAYFAKGGEVGTFDPTSFAAIFEMLIGFIRELLKLFDDE